VIDYLLTRHPKLRESFRFHFDTWINHEYYPHSGDSGGFAYKSPDYAGIIFGGGVYSLLGRLAHATGDPLYWRMAWIGNGFKTDGLPHDIFAADPGEYAAQIKATIDQHGAWPRVGSVNKEQWRIAVLRHSRAAGAAIWLDYDSLPESAIKNHYHFDAMNVGIFAKGLDLLPELGYSAVQYGDWHTPQALWTKKTASHNTVMEDSVDQNGGPSETVIWKGEGPVQVIRARSPQQYGGTAYERTLVMVESSASDFYVLDGFDVAGGKHHAKHTHPAFAAARSFGLRTQAVASPYDAGTLMCGFQCDPRPAPRRGVDWKIEDFHHYRPTGSPDVHVRYTDLTHGASACTAEMWVLVAGSEHWIPAVVTSRESAGGNLSSTFVAVLEPYETASKIQRIPRIDKPQQGRVEVEVERADGSRDRRESGIEWLRRDRSGRFIGRGEATGR
jgi:hypothetical protein